MSLIDSSNVYLYANVDADGQSNITPELWAENIYMRARKAAVMTPLMSVGAVRQDNTILGRSGYKFTLPKMDHLSASDLTEGTPTPVSSLTFDGVEVTVRERGIATQMSTHSNDVSVSSFESTVIENMGAAVAEKLNADLVAELGATTTDAVYPVVSGARRTSATIEAGDTFTLEQINEADTVMQTTLNQRGLAVLIHPRQEKVLRDDSQFIDASQYGDASVLRQTGEIGRLYGKTVIVSNHVDSALEGAFTSPATEGEVPVYKGFLLGANACIFAPKRALTFEADRGDVRDRAVTLHTWHTYGFQNFEEAAIVPLKSA